MRKFYPVSKGRFSACLCKIYAVKVCVNLVEILSFLSDFIKFYPMISYVTQIGRISLISYKTFFRKGEER